MSESADVRPPLSDRSGVTDGVRVQILATEHWGLLANRTLIWNEAFSRASMFLTVLSAATVALALVAQATDFDQEFRLFALLVLPIVLLLGWATYVRVVSTTVEDVWLTAGMNRLRHAYLELAPELEPYFITGFHDDETSVFRTLTLGDHVRASRLRVVASTSLLVGIITAAVAGVFAGLLVATFGGGTLLVVPVGALTAIAYGALTYSSHMRLGKRFRSVHTPRFPATEPAP